MSFLLGDLMTWLSSVDPADVPADATSQLGWSNMPSSWRVFVFVAVLAAVVMLAVALYRREMPSCPRRVKMFLAALRIAVCLLLALVFLGPAITFTRTKAVEPVLLLMRDASYSMNESDQYLDDDAASAAAAASNRSVEAVRSGGIRRADLLNEVLLQDDEAWIQKLNELGKLRVLNFSNGTTQVNIDLPEAAKSEAPTTKSEAPTSTHQPILPQLVAEGQGTDLVHAISKGLSVPNVAAIILMTDGQHSVGSSGGNEVLQAARKAKDRDVKLLLVGIGDPTVSANVKVADVYALAEVWKNHPFEIQAQLRLQNVSVPSLHVELLEQRLDEDGLPVEDLRVIQQRDVDVDPEASQLRLTFDHVVKQKGRYAYNVRVAPFESETNKADNQPKTAVPVQVLSDMRVLLLAGQPDWEFQLLKVLLHREPSINLSCWLQNLDRRRLQDGNTPIDRLPDTPTEFVDYDVIMLLDPDPRQLPSGWMEQLKQFVGDESKGLFYLAGPRFCSSFLAAAETRGFRDILPVDFGDVERLELESLGETYQRQWKMDVAARNADLPILRFYPDAQQSLQKWRNMPAFYWSFPAMEAKPAARTLIERQESDRGVIPRPLLVSGMYGSGRVVYMGFNGTWRWRRSPNDVTFYRRYWLQTVRYLVEGQTAASRGRGTLEVDRQRYALGDRIALSARRVKDDAYELLKDDEITVVVQPGEGTPESIQLKAVSGQPGAYAGTFTAATIGRHKVTLEQGGGETSATLPTTTFAVTVPQLETNESWLNEPLLTNIAGVAGGKYFHLDQLDELLGEIPTDKAKKLRIKGQPIPLWDNSRLLVLLVGLLCCEWIVRKRYRLI